MGWNKEMELEVEVEVESDVETVSESIGQNPPKVLWTSISTRVHCSSVIRHPPS